MSFATEAKLLSGKSGYIELWDLDLTYIGQGTIFQFTDYTGPNYTAIVWNSNPYVAIPVSTSGFEWNGTDDSPATPTITVSNVNSVLLPYVIGDNDIVGAKLTRTRTFAKFLDHGTNPDPAQCITDTYIVAQKTSHTRLSIAWSLRSPLDQQSVMLPRRQILKDQGFPGVNRTPTS